MTEEEKWKSSRTRNHLISRKMGRQFIESHPGAKRDEATIMGDLRLIEEACWKTFADIKQSFATADQVGHYVVINCGGNKYRIVVQVIYQPGAAATVLVRYVLTHKEYDHLDL